MSLSLDMHSPISSLPATHLRIHFRASTSMTMSLLSPFSFSNKRNSRRHSTPNPLQPDNPITLIPPTIDSNSITLAHHILPSLDIDIVISLSPPPSSPTLRQQKTQSVIIPSSTHALQSVTSSAYDRSHPESAVAIGAGLASSAPAIGRPAILEKKGSLVRRKKLKSLHSNIPSSSNTPVSATPDQFGRISGIPVTTSRNRTNSAGSNSNAQVSTEMMAFVDLTGQGPFNEVSSRRIRDSRFDRSTR